MTSVLSNFISDACLQSDQSRLVESANDELRRHVASLHDFLQVNPSTTAVIVPPLPRLVPDWFNAYLPCFTTFLIGEVTRFGCSRLQILAPFIALPSSFESDGIHLTAASGFCFIQYLINGLDQVGPPSVSGLASSSQAPSAPSYSTPSVASSTFTAPSYSAATQFQPVPFTQSNPGVSSQAPPLLLLHLHKIP